MRESYIRTSRITGKKYDLFQVVRILNLTQVCYYLSYGVLPVHIYAGVDNKTEKPCLIFLFDKEETKEVYDLWCKHEIEYIPEDFNNP